VNLPNDVATDATHVYWVEDGSYTPNYAGDGRVLRRPKDGGASEVLATGRFSPARLLLDADSVYWSDEGDYWDTSKPGRIARVPKTGGTVTEITSDSVVYGLAMDGATMYFFNATTVKKVSKAGGNASVLAGAIDALNAIDADSSGVYFTSSTQDGLPVSQSMGTVQRVAPTGGALTLLAEAKAAGGVTVTTSFVFFGTKGTVMRLPKSGGTALSMASSSGVTRLVADDAFVYWTDCSGGAVLAVPIAGGDPITLASGYVCPAGISVSPDYVYFTERGNGFGTVADDHAGKIVRVPRISS
jgi:sugar lactone lactonase YvrE